MSDFTRKPPAKATRPVPNPRLTSKGGVISATGSRPRLNAPECPPDSIVLLTFRDIHSMYRYSESAVRFAIRTRGFPKGLKDGSRHLFRKAEVDAYFESLAQEGVR